MNQTSANIDPVELAKFADSAHRWWDPESEYKPLHQINPVRLDFIERHSPLRGQRVLDVGCGGGILSEGMAKRGATVSGIDAGREALEVAKLHLLESGLQIDYQHTTAEDFAETHENSFDAVTCLEMLEHVPDPASVIAACAKMVKPGGKVFFSTINRNPKAYALAIVGAEYIMKMLTPGTHDYEKFIKPSELSAWIREADMNVLDIRGMSYNPIGKEFRLSKDIDVNYLICAQKD